MVNLASLSRLQKMVASLLNVNPEDMSYSAAVTTDQEKYHPDHITDAILLIDLEVCKVHQETIGDGYRSQYGDVQAVAYGESIPPHPGRVGYVEIKQAASSEFERGIKVRSIDQIRKYRSNPNTMYDATIYWGRYHVDEDDRLYFLGDSAQVFTPDDLVITTACQAPAVDEVTIARGSVSLLAKDGMDLSFLGKYAAEYQADTNRTRSLGGPAPPLDMFVKTGS